MQIDIVERVENKLPGETYLVAVTTLEGNTVTCAYWTDGTKDVFTIPSGECELLGMTERTEEPIYSGIKQEVVKKIKELKQNDN